MAGREQDVSSISLADQERKERILEGMASVPQHVVGLGLLLAFTADGDGNEPVCKLSTVSPQPSAKNK